MSRPVRRSRHHKLAMGPSTSISLWALLLLAPMFVRGCTVDVNDDNAMPLPQPLFLLPGGSRDIYGILTPDASGVLTVEDGAQITIACPGTTIEVLGQETATATCVSDSTFTVDGQAYAFEDLSCNVQPQPSARETGNTCGFTNEYTEIELGFQVDADFYSLITTCFDSILYRTIYSHGIVLGTIGGRQSGFDDEDWLDLGYFGNIDLTDQYRRASQIVTVGDLLGSSALGEQYISESTDYFLSKGHLTAKADFILGALEYASYVYLNAAPEWQTLNGANWNTLENNVRSYAADNGVDLQIYTGTYGITTLPNVDGVETELYLYANGDDRAVPAPMLFWKVVYEPSSQAATVFVSINNPYIDNPGAEYYVCTDVCGQVGWVTWSQDDQQDGYSYCCEYEDFRQTVVDAPAVTVGSLLT